METPLSISRECLLLELRWMCAFLPKLTKMSPACTNARRFRFNVPYFCHGLTKLNCYCRHGCLHCDRYAHLGVCTGDKGDQLCTTCLLLDPTCTFAVGSHGASYVDQNLKNTAYVLRCDNPRPAIDFGEHSLYLDPNQLFEVRGKTSWGFQTVLTPAVYKFFESDIHDIKAFLKQPDTVDFYLP